MNNNEIEDTYILAPSNFVDMIYKYQIQIWFTYDQISGSMRVASVKIRIMEERFYVKF